MLSALARDQQQQIPVRNPYPESADIIQLQHGASAHGIRPCSNLSTSRGAFGDIGIAVAIMLYCYCYCYCHSQLALFDELANEQQQSSK